MEIDITELVDYLDKYSIEKQLYYVVPTLYDSEEYIEMHLKEGKWLVGIYKGDEHKQVITANLIEALAALETDLENFTSQVVDTVILTCTYYQGFINKASEVIGVDLLEQGMAEYNEFMNEVVKAVESALNPKPKLKLIEGE